MKIYNHKRRNLFSIGSHLLGLIFIATGLFAIISPYVIESENSMEKALTAGIAFIIFGSVVVFSFGGTLIDFTSNKIKEYYSICGLQVGQWQNLPEINKVMVVSEQIKSTRKADGIHPTTSGMIWVYKALLFSQKSKFTYSFEYSSKEQTLNDAKLLADNLNAVLELRLTENNGQYSV